MPIVGTLYGITISAIAIALAATGHTVIGIAVALAGMLVAWLPTVVGAVRSER